MVSATLTLLTADVTGGDPQATGGGQDFVDGAGGESFVSDMQDALALDMPADYVEINVDPPSPPPGRRCRLERHIDDARDEHRVRFAVW